MSVRVFDCECGYGEGKADERDEENEKAEGNEKARKGQRAFVGDITAQGLDRVRSIVLFI